MKPVALACLAVLLLTACSDQQPLQPPAGPAPSALIMDGAHHGGNPDFFFLPPLAADPTGGPNFDAGKFNPNLAPTAEVCRLTGDPASGAVDCATDTQNKLVLVLGPKQMVLAVEQYQVTWDTKSPTLLDASKFYRIIVRGAPRGTMLGLLDVDPVTGGLKDVRTGEVVQFQDGRSLPIKVRIEQGAFGVTNPDTVEQVVTNHITTPTGTVDVTTNTGFAGARLVDNWLPARAVAAGIDRVIVIIERVPVNNAVPATSCLKSGFKELEGCYRFRTDPDLHPYGSFNTTVIAGVCFEQPIHSDAPYEMFRREETGEQELVHLDDSDAPFLNCATFSVTGGGGTVGGGPSVPRVTGSDGCASAPWVLGSTTSPDANRLTAAAAASPSTLEFTATGLNLSMSVFDQTGDASVDGRVPVSPDLVISTASAANGNLALSVRFAPGTFSSLTTLVQVVLDTDRDPSTGSPGVDAGGVNDAGIMSQDYLVEMGSALHGTEAVVRRYAGTPNQFTPVGP